MAEAIIPRRTINKQEYVLLADVTVETATTSVDITGLSIDKDSEYMLVSDINANASIDFAIYFNGNTTSTNYYNQYLYAGNTSIIAGRQNIPYFIYGASMRSFGIANIKLTNNGYVVYQSSTNRNYGSSSLELHNFYGTSTFTTTSITSLRISGSTNSIGAGSRFQLYKVGA